MSSHLMAIDAETTEFIMLNWDHCIFTSPNVIIIQQLLMLNPPSIWQGGTQRLYSKRLLKTKEFEYGANMSYSKSSLHNP